MLTAATLKGMWAGLPVAWTAGDEFDEARYRRNVARCCEIGVHGAYTHGSTGEFYAQSFEEWCAVATAHAEECRSHGTPFQIGITDLSTRQAVRKAEIAARLGADAVQTAFPFWMPLGPDEAVQFLLDVAASVPGLPIVLYGTARARTLTTPALLRRALDAGAPLIGCKYTGPTADVPGLVQACPEVSFLVGEANLATGMAAGARGACSAYVYACPRYMLRYFSLCESGQWAAAQEIEAHVQAWHAGPCQHLFARGLQDSALDRVFAHAAGFMDIELRCRPPYASATEADLAEYVRRCEAGFGEFLHDSAA